MDRKKALEAELERIIRIICNGDPPQKVILFGSLVTGEVKEWSDLDLIIVKEINVPFLERIKNFLLLIQPRVGIDLLVYTPKEFEELCRSRAFFREEIVKKGKLLYERK